MQRRDRDIRAGVGVVDRQDFVATALPDVDDLVLSWISSPAFDEILTETVVTTYPAHEVDQFLAHFRGLLDLWIHDQQQQPQPTSE